MNARDRMIVAAAQLYASIIVIVDWMKARHNAQRLSRAMTCAAYRSHSIACPHGCGSTVTLRWMQHTSHNTFSCCARRSRSLAIGDGRLHPRRHLLVVNQRLLQLGQRLLLGAVNTQHCYDLVALSRSLVSAARLLAPCGARRDQRAPSSPASRLGTPPLRRAALLTARTPLSPAPQLVPVASRCSLLACLPSHSSTWPCSKHTRSLSSFQLLATKTRSSPHPLADKPATVPAPHPASTEPTLARFDTSTAQQPTHTARLCVLQHSKLAQLCQLKGNSEQASVRAESAQSVSLS